MSTTATDTITLPTIAKLRDLARVSLQRCGVDLATSGPTITARTPVTRQRPFELKSQGNQDTRAA
jgi:aldehyde dehydrogenase (NAD+)